VAILASLKPFDVAVVSMSYQTALITGAGGGIGQAIARSLAGRGMRLALVSRDREKLEQLRRNLDLSEEKALIAPCDVTDRDQVRTAVEAVIASMGVIDVLVCAAGINVAQRSLRSLEPADWDRVLQANLTGVFNVIHQVLPAMRNRGNGLIIQIGSVSGLRASTLAGAAYSASKFAQSALAICIGREERGRGIRSTVIHPGEVNTPFLDQRAGRPGATEGGRRELILQPEDIAAAVEFLIDLPPRAHVPELIIKPTIDDFF
jgi:NADP-dependent 3-hydroxy acid dehydrogenase YdfG